VHNWIPNTRIGEGVRNLRPYGQRLEAGTNGLEIFLHTQPVSTIVPCLKLNKKFQRGPVGSTQRHVTRSFV
jgi:hypothetical protein